MALLPVLALTTHVLCVMATGNTTVTTSPRGMWTVNKLYYSLPHTPNLMQKDGAPQTPKAMVMEKEDDKTPIGSRPQSASRRISDIGGGNRCVQYNTPRPGRCLYYTELLQCWAHIQS